MNLLQNVLQDMRYGARILWKSPGLSATAVILIALVIGGNTTIFSMVHAFISRPAPGVRKPNLVMLGVASTRFEPFHSYPEYLEFATQSKTVRALVGYGPERITLRNENGTTAVFGSYATTNYFEDLGVPLSLGRGFTEADDRGDGTGLVVVISYRVWQEQFQGTKDILGRVVTINGHDATIIGVASEYFQGAELAVPEDVWVPAIPYFRVHRREQLLRNRGDLRFGFIVIGQLVPTVSLSQAQAEFATISARIQASYPGINKNKVVRPMLYTATNNAGISHGAPQFLAIFSVITALTLIVVCANVANLLLARSISRQRDTALQQALGASRQRILRILFVEGVALSVAAWIAVSLFAFGVSKLLPLLIESQTINPLGMRSNLMNMDLSPDRTVLAYAMLLAFLATVAFTIAPAIRMWKQDVLRGLKLGEPSVARGRSRLASGLVVTQLAFSVVLLTAAGLAYRSLSLIENLDLGFNSGNLLLVTVNPSLSVPNREANLAFLEALRQRLQTMPGVQATSYSRMPPAINRREPIRLPASQTSVIATTNYVGPDYLRVLGLSPILGREFASDERSRSPKTVIVNENLARFLWPGRSALGETVLLNRGQDSAEVVGVVPNALFSGRNDPYFLFLAEQQDVARVTGQAALYESGETTFYVRYNSRLDAIAPAIRRIVSEVDERVPVVYMRTMDTQLETGRTGTRTVAVFLSFFSGGSLLIASLGQYAAVAFEMKRRTREFGIRLAMGASRHQLERTVLSEGLVLTVIGLIVGFLLSFTTALALRSFLAGVTPTDMGTYAGVFGLLAAASLIACYLPARRASRVDPLVTLRYE